MFNKSTIFLFVLMILILLTACQDGQFTLPSAADFAEPSLTPEAAEGDVTGAAQAGTPEAEPVAAEAAEGDEADAAQADTTEAEPVETGTPEAEPVAAEAAEGDGSDAAQAYTPEAEPVAATSTATGVVFSEILIAVPGDNNREFIELYNPTETAVDLNGHSLWYRLDVDQEEVLLYTWEERAEVPPLGHYLLAREGQDFGLTPDVVFDAPLSQRKGGLVLRNAEGETVSQFGWGEAPEGFVAGTAVQALSDGASMERLPGGDAGHGTDSGDNAADFTAREEPNPQNSGSPATPLAGDHLLVSLAAPAEVEPGVEFDLVINVENQGTQDAPEITVALPTIPEFTLVTAPPGAEEAEGLLSWSLPGLEAGERVDSIVTVQSPFTYIDRTFSGAYAEADGWLRDYSAPQLTTMAGGAIPIATARELVDSTVSIEGVATMYTGGF
ncbi:MAG: lamin tail domain-containing protein, partial [Candidatus Promineifilaceae bacterium]|nr:lamin tail domain-containing protein [Candidatus Promineifilaceae bacterium]